MPTTRSAGRTEVPVPISLAFAELADLALAEGNRLSAATLIDHAYAAADAAEAQTQTARGTAGRVDHAIAVAA